MSTTSIQKYFLFMVVILLSLAKVKAQPCYSGYNYRLPIFLNNTSNAEEKDLQISVTVNTASLVSSSKMLSSGADIRFLDRKGNPLNYWIEDGTMNSSATKIWVRTDSILAYSYDTLYMYYGNTSSSAASNRANTFTIYDDFTGGSLGSGWTTCGSGSSSVSGGVLTISSGASTQRTIRTVSSFTGPLLVEMKVNTSNPGSGTTFLGTSNSTDNGYALQHGSNMGIYRMTSSTSCYTPTSINTPSSAGTVAGTWTFRWANVGNEYGSWPGGTSSASGTAFSFGANQKVMFGVTSGGTLDIDWIQVRKYTSSTIGLSFGTEVSNTYTITPSYNSPICEASDLQLTVNQVPGATYLWTGPSGSGFTSTQREPVVNGVKLSDAGQYSVKVTIPTGCATQTKTVNVSVTAKSVGGTLNGSTTVCSGSNTGSLTLVGQTGNIQNWDTAQSASGPWTSISNTTNSRSFLDLSSSTFYRVIVKNGTCATDTSSMGAITVTPASNGGTVSGRDTVCTGTNAGSLVVSGAVGNVERWEKSTNGFLWSSIVNRSTVQSYTNLTQTTFYRAIVKNGLCNEAASNSETIFVNSQSVGGSVSGTSIACEGSNSGSLVLSGRNGSVVQWESSANGSSPWTTISNTSDTFSFNNLTYTQYFRAVVKNGVCGSTPSSAAIVNIIDASDAGDITGGTTVCESANSGMVVAANYTGSIQKWQYQNANTSGWQDIINTSANLSWNSLTDTTAYRVIVSNQGCPADTSSIGYINVNKVSQSGFHTGDNQVCEGTNTGDIYLQSYRGDILRWESSTTGFSPWTTITNTTNLLSYSNLNTDLYYRAVVKNGICSSVNSSPFTVTVDKNSDGGISLDDISVCSGSNYGLIGLANYTGDVVNWEKTNDSTLNNWIAISNFTNRQDFRDLTEKTFYRAVVKNGVCGTAKSTITTITVSEPTVGGSIDGDTSFCSSTNAGNITLNSFTGDVVRWESSSTGSSPWTQIVDSTALLTYSNIPTSTYYRAIVKSGVCSQLASEIAVIQVFPASSGGVVLSEDTASCSGINFGSVTLAGHTGNISRWQSSTDGGATWKGISNTTTQLYFFNLTEPTLYRTIVQNASCDADTSDALLVNIYDQSVAGKVDELTEACESISSGYIKLKEYAGNIDKWQLATSLAGPWTDIATTADSIEYNSPIQSTYYRAVVSSGACGSSISNAGLLKVYQPTQAGTLMGGGEVCDSSNSGELFVVGEVGSVRGWETAPSATGPWTLTGQTTAGYSYFNIHDPLFVRAKVKNGACADGYTNTVGFTINEVPSVDFEVENACGGGIASFKDLSTINNGSIVDYYWAVSDGYTTGKKDFTKSFAISGNFLVNLQVRSDKGCTGSISRSIPIEEPPLANFVFRDILGANAACSGDSVTFKNLTADPLGTGLEYVWDFGDGTTSIVESPRKEYDQAGIYTIKLIVATTSDCKDSLSRELQVYSTLNPKAGDDVSISKGRDYQLEATGGVIYRWEPEEFLDNASIANPTANIVQTTQFVVYASDQIGCVGRDTIVLSVVDDYKIRPNNVITPEGNGSNDVWIVANLENYPGNTVSVFDRWGHLVFEQRDYQNDWGATNLDGNLLLDGTYYYVISFDTSDKVYKGAITVVRNK